MCETPPFPDLHHDNLQVRDFSALSDEALDFKTNQYGAFLQRKDIMKRGRELGDRVMEHLLFELGWRDGVYEEGLDDAC